MSKREHIIAAAKALLWEKGYEATSPRDIQLRSDSGQGSFYHHFATKQELARIAIEEVVAGRLADFEAAMTTAGGFRQRLIGYFAQNRQPLLGCKVGRLVWDAAIDEKELRRPLARYFQHIEARLIEMLEQEAAAGHVEFTLPAPHIALIIVATIQGSYTVSRAQKRDRAVHAREALLAFFDVAVRELAGDRADSAPSHPAAPAGKRRPKRLTH